LKAIPLPIKSPKLSKEQIGTIRREVRGEVLKEPVSVFKGAGGPKEQVEAPSLTQLIEESSSRFQYGRVAGLVLITIEKMSRELPQKAPGLAGAAALMRKSPPPGQVPKSRHHINRYWQEFRSVSHLYAAWELLAAIAGFGNTAVLAEIIHRDTSVLLAVAKQFQDFAASYYAHGQKAPLLMPSEVWSVPSNLRLPSIPSLGLVNQAADLLTLSSR
jgi:hypothetical protein